MTQRGPLIFTTYWNCLESAFFANEKISKRNRRLKFLDQKTSSFVFVSFKEERKKTFTKISEANFLASSIGWRKKNGCSQQTFLCSLEAGAKNFASHDNLFINIMSQWHVISLSGIDMWCQEEAFMVLTIMNIWYELYICIDEHVHRKW